MDPRDRLQQRWLDGELGPAELAAFEHLTAADPALADERRRLEGLHAALGRVAGSRRPLDGERLVAAIRERLPARPPRRDLQISVIQIAVLTGFAVAIGAFRALRGSLADYVPLTVIALTAVVLGSLCFAAAGPLCRADARFFGRLLRKRLAVGTADVWTYRLVGVAIVIGGFWLLR